MSSARTLLDALEDVDEALVAGRAYSDARWPTGFSPLDDVLGGGLRGSTALAHEADVALLLNDKHAIVARHHLMYGTTNAELYKQWAVCSVEKNRSGRDGVDVQFRKHFTHGHFDPAGEHVTEQLIDDRVYVE